MAVVRDIALGAVFCISIFSNYSFFTALGFHVGYLECENPENFPRRSLIAMIACDIAYVMCSILTSLLGLNTFVGPIEYWLLANACLFMIVGPIFAMFYLPSWRFELAFASIVFSLPFTLVHIVLCLIGSIEFELNFELLQTVLPLIGVFVAIFAAPMIMALIADMVDKIKDLKKAKKDKAALMLTLSSLGIKYNEHATNKKCVRQTKSKIRKLQRRRQHKNFTFGPQLTDYLCNCGHLNVNGLTLCGVGENIPEKYDMIRLDAQLYQLDPWYEHWSVIEVVDEKTWAIVNHYTDNVQFYDIESKQWHPFGDKIEIKGIRWPMYENDKLYDYIKKRAVETIAK